ncbi:MAG: di-heme oxidoredictase family protein, partial [Phycisphaerae bacterium]
DLFDLISFVMLLAVPEFDAPTVQTDRGRRLFGQAGCTGCHTPRLNGPRGPLPVFADLLLHDMGPALADGIIQGVATGSEFRTQPLWGVPAVGPYLHDGRAESLEAAILMHGGEAQSARDAFAAFSEQQRADVIEFLHSLGGRSQFSPGLLELNAPVPDVGAYGGPFRAMSPEERDRFVRGRGVFDRDFGHATGIGALSGADGGARFNGDSCRACHFDPVIGGSGPRDVNVMRHGIINGDGSFTAPLTTPNTILHKEIRVGSPGVAAADNINVLEHRQTPHTFGVGLIDAIAESTILANADPTDADADGISGRAHVLSDGRIGRLGWKAQVPNVGEFVRDAMAAEIGLTIPLQSGLSFGITEDGDGIPDPELSVAEAEDLAFFLSMLAGPPRQTAADPGAATAGEALFTSVGCTKCHIPSLPSSLGGVPLFSDLLLHDILAAGSPGIEDGDATQTEFRTSPLWGISQTAPYLHSGAADNLDQAIRMHAGEADAVRTAYEALSDGDRAALLEFLGTL